MKDEMIDRMDGIMCGHSMISDCMTHGKVIKIQERAQIMTRCAC